MNDRDKTKPNQTSEYQIQNRKYGFNKNRVTMSNICSYFGIFTTVGILLVDCTI